MHPFRVSLTVSGALALALAFDSLAQGSTDPLPSEIVTHPDLVVTLFAMEPDVVDPVALCFDPAGRMFVLEMRDYPYGVPPENEPGGTVRMLEDTNGDGRADQSVVFAEGLNFPTSIAPYRDGVLVAAPPEIVFLRDTDGDGKSDEREVLFEGFGLEVTDSNFSGLRWGLDNWLHGVNGGNGGSISSLRSTKAPVRLGDLDFKLNPDTGAIETTYSTGGGFGLVFDDWGRSFTPHNINHMQMRIMESRVLSRHGGLPPIEGTHSISDHGEMARIFPISEARTRPNHPEQAGHFSSSGGMGYIGHSGYPGDLPGSLLVCDVVGNIVHRDVLSADGPIFKASRAPGEQDREFLASTDPRFRPTGLELGPDGALYLMDMHRDVIEHPDYIPKKMLAEMDIRAGDDKGRIYRIVPRNGLPPVKTDLTALTTEELVNELASPNQWRRMTAQRLLVEGERTDAVPLLKTLAYPLSDPLPKVHALWTLVGLGRLGGNDAGARLLEPDDRVIENLLQMVRGPNKPRDWRLFISFAGGGDNERVRFTALSLLAEADLPLYETTIPPGWDLPAPPLLRAVESVLRQDGEFPWSRRAALSALPNGEMPLLEKLLRDEEFVRSEFAEDVLGELADLVGARLKLDYAFIDLLDAVASYYMPDSVTIRVMEGLDSGLARARSELTPPPSWRNAMEQVANGESLAVQRAVWKVEDRLRMPPSRSRARAISDALAQAVDASLDQDRRVEAIELLALADPGEAVAVLLKCLDGTEHVAIQSPAVARLSGWTDASIANGFIDRWRSIHPELKRSVTLLMLRRRAYHDPLLTALESGRISVGELNLDLEDRRTLLRWSTDDIHDRAAKILGDGEYGNRQTKVDEWMAKLPATGDGARGREVFETLCATCHRSGGLGFEVGPDLSAMSHRSVEDLVSNILDPNMAINPNYQSVTIETVEGEIVIGILAAESTDAISLSLAGGVRSTLARSDISRMESAGRSLMPEGIEAGMTPESLRDLVAFLRGE